MNDKSLSQQLAERGPIDWSKYAAPDETSLKHRLWVLWMRGAYWPYCDVRRKLTAAWRAMHDSYSVVSHDELVALTTPLEAFGDDDALLALADEALEKAEAEVVR